MKFNKAVIAAGLVLGSLLAGGLASQAQDNTNTPPAGGPGGGMRRGGPGMNFEFISKQLDLTDDQKPKVKPIIEDMQKQLADYRQNNPDATMTDRRAKMKEIRDGVTTKLKDILTADQLAKWDKMSTRRPNGAGGPPPGGAPPSGTPPAGTPPAGTPPADAPK